MAPGAIDIGPSSGTQVRLERTVERKRPTSRSQPEHEEYQYLDLIRDILNDGEHRPDRTGTGTYSIFAPRQLRFTLSRASSPSTPPTLLVPLLTTKRVFLRAVLAELLWFISGSTSSATLTAQNIHIWDGNGSRAYLDSIGLTSRAAGDLGPVYGFQWRHFGAEYVDAETDYKGKGVDQLAEVVRKLRTTPWDRRIILSAWNPADLGKMALPPCHMFAQFYVSFPSRRRKQDTPTTVSRAAADGTPQEEDEEATGAQGKQKEKGVLHTLLYQRSCDMGLGVPFNIASYALLTHMLAHVCDLIPGTLTHTMGDAHVYLDHVEALEVQLQREPREFATLQIRRERCDGSGGGGGGVEDMEGWRVEDFVVKGYDPHKAVAMKMSV